MNSRRKLTIGKRSMKIQKRNMMRNLRIRRMRMNLLMNLFRDRLLRKSQSIQYFFDS